MRCDRFVDEHNNCTEEKCGTCDSRLCDEHEDCLNFDIEECTGKDSDDCEDYVSADDILDDMHPNETHDEFMEHEDFN